MEQGFIKKKYAEVNPFCGFPADISKGRPPNHPKAVFQGHSNPNRSKKIRTKEVNRKAKAQKKEHKRKPEMRLERQKRVGKTESRGEREREKEKKKMACGNGRLVIKRQKK